ncbi:hypothetical protein M501DRAFT_1002965 [Patellaria atrata CBS 101060]|uniref:Required for respiratory growth protein 9, mitochondrial n=1 Tax=Patellaria atrata CBS 101060 TaxID=1346257 RepID=A0A9P4SBB5_9PEZI|nr:hypothetical protein M501DRAFT_1002965 [Patellaria atrata CBS 101060]
MFCLHCSTRVLEFFISSSSTLSARTATHFFTQPARVGRQLHIAKPYNFPRRCSHTALAQLRDELIVEDTQGYSKENGRKLLRGRPERSVSDESRSKSEVPSPPSMTSTKDNDGLQTSSSLVVSSQTSPSVQHSKERRDSNAKKSPIQKSRPTKVSPDTNTHVRKFKREPWQIQKEGLHKKFKDESWAPRKRLSPDALEGIRALHAKYPDKFTTPVLAEEFKISPDAIRRILKSKWRPSAEEEEDRRERWEKRGERVWTNLAELGTKPPKKWRIKGIGKSEFGGPPKWKTHRTRQQPNVAKRPPKDNAHIPWGESD